MYLCDDTVSTYCTRYQGFTIDSSGSESSRIHKQDVSEWGINIRDRYDVIVIQNEGREVRRTGPPLSEP